MFKNSHDIFLPSLTLTLLMLILIFSPTCIANDSIHESLEDGVLLGGHISLDPSKKPNENFDLLDWSLTLPTDLNKDKKADIIYENRLVGALN